MSQTHFGNISLSFDMKYKCSKVYIACLIIFNDYLPKKLEEKSHKASSKNFISLMKDDRNILFKTHVPCLSPVFSPFQLSLKKKIDF